MKKSDVVRVLLYVGTIVLVVLAAQWKKADIIEKKNKVSVSLPNEYKKFGTPVDVERVSKKEFNELFRVSVSSFKNSEAHILLSRQETTRIKPGQEVLHPDNGSVIGKVKSVNSEADLTTGLYVANIQVPKKLLGESKSLDVVINKSKQSLSVPIDAVDTTIEGAEYHVWIASPDNKAISKAVKIGLQSSARAEVVSGLEEGEMVVVNGQKYLKVNDNLRIRKCLFCESQAEEVAK